MSDNAAQATLERLEFLKWLDEADLPKFKIVKPKPVVVKQPAKAKVEEDDDNDIFNDGDPIWAEATFGVMGK